MQLSFRQAGYGHPLIILHGLFGSGDNWVTVTKPLAEKFSVYVIDQRNHGRSPHIPEHSYQTMAYDIVQFLDQHKIQDPFVLGHSMGGKTAMQLALNYPERVKKLIVGDISPRYYSPHHQNVIAGFQAINLSSLSSREEADKLMSAHLSDRGERQFLLKNLYRTDNGGFAWRMNLNGLIDQIENIGMENTGTPFPGPALFIRGELSKYIQETDRELINKLFPVNQIKTIAEAGHWVQAEKPAEFVQLVTDFLEN